MHEPASASLPPAPCEPTSCSLPTMRHLLIGIVTAVVVTGYAVSCQGQEKLLPQLPSQFATPTLDGWQFHDAQLIAYEDHERFTYLVASVPPEDARKPPEPDQGLQPLIRRFILLKPSTIVVDDLVPRDENVERQVHVLYTFPPYSENAGAHSELAREGNNLKLTIRSDDRIHKLNLPPADAQSGDIAIENADGQKLLPNRLLTSGVLPFGVEGIRLLERWDSAYRRQDPAPWDIGRPSVDLVKAVDDGTLAPCRAVVLGCGTGTNAIYLAQQGFDVTGVDIAPTALKHAHEKAKRAGVKVHWILADVTAPPKLAPFDLVFDRGCYHGVRRENAVEYVASLRQLTHADSQILILAGNANEERHYGPPRVKESEIRSDFSQDFEIQSLKEAHFDTMTVGEKGALAWSILLRRVKGR